MAEEKNPSITPLVNRRQGVYDREVPQVIAKLQAGMSIEQVARHHRVEESVVAALAPEPVEPVGALIDVSQDKGPAPMVVNFSANKSTGPIVQYLWEFGDGMEEDGRMVQHAFLEAGVYAVKLYVSGANGQADVEEVEITVTEE